MKTPNDSRLRGKALDGSDQKNSADHLTVAASGNADVELHLDDETDSLYNDGLDVEDDSETLADTKGTVHRG